MTPPAQNPASAPEARTDAPWTIRRVLTWTRDKFVARGIPSARLDAELLLCHCLGLSRVALYTHYEQPLAADELGRLRDLIKRRLGGEPVAYLVEQKEFYGLPLRVTKAVLIPRPETEFLVETALRLLSGRAPAAPAGELVVQYETDAAAADAPDAAGEAAQSAPLPGVELSYEPLAPEAEAPETGAAAAATPPAAAERPTDDAQPAAGPARIAVDIGTGSGAVALALKHGAPSTRVLAIDVSPDALAIARGNAEKLGLDVEFLHGDLLAPLPPGLLCDVIAANLPYIPAADIAQLQPEVRCEPKLALDGGPDGLDIVRRLVRQAPARLRPGGGLALEIGDGQARYTAELLRAAGFTEVTIEDDLAKIPRIVSGRRPQ